MKDEFTHRKKGKLNRSNRNVTNFAPKADPNSYVVKTKDGFEIDYSQFVYGQATQANKNHVYYPFRGQKALIDDIRDALEAWLKDYCSAETEAGFKKQKNWVFRYLNSLWKFFDSTNKTDVRLSDIDEILINSHHSWLLNSGIVKGTDVANNVAQIASFGRGFLAELSNRYGLLEGMRLRNAQNASITYPSTEGSTNKPLKNISPFAMEYVQKLALRILEEIDQGAYAKVQPERGDDVEKLEHQAFAFEDTIEALIRGEIKAPEGVGHLLLEHWSERYGFERKPVNNSTSMRTTGVSPTELIYALYPSMLEVAATGYLIGYDTGFVDAIAGIDITEQFYHTTAKDPKNPRAADTVTIFMERPKTRHKGAEKKAAHTSGRYGSAWWALNRIIKRTERLRSLAEQILPEAHEARTSPLIYLPKEGWSIKALTGSDVWPTLKLHIAKALEEDTELTDTQRREIENAIFKDVRDAKVIRKVDEGADLIELQEILGHKSFITTYEYLRSHILKKKFFSDWAHTTGLVYDEVTNGYTIDPVILRARFLLNRKGLDDLTEDERTQLATNRTVGGAWCQSSNEPPEALGNLGQGKCKLQLCAICPNAVFIPNAPGTLEDMAEQAAMLQFYEDTVPEKRFERTPQQMALLTHREIRKEFFSDRDAEYAEIYQEHYDALSENMEDTVNA